MPELSEQLTTLIDASARPVSFDEVVHGRSAAPTVCAGRAYGSRRLAVATLSVAAVLIVVATAVVSTDHFGGGGRPRSTPAAATRAPGSWRLTASLSASQFTLGTGAPDEITGADCSGDPTCFLSTIYGLGGATSTVTGSTYVSHDAGHAWEPTELPANVATTTLVTCVTTQWCAAGGGAADPKTGDPAAGKVMRDPELLTTDDAGKHWETHAVPLPVDVQQLPAYGSLPAETTYWPGTVDAVTCSAPGVCNVVGHVLTDRPGVVIPDEIVFLSTHDGGAHWTQTVLPERADIAGDEVLGTSSTGASMACPTRERCVIAVSLGLLGPAEYFWTTTDGGRTWQQSPQPGVAATGVNVVCTSTSVCWSGPNTSTTAPGSETVLRSTDGGSTWASATLPVVGGPGPGQTSGWSSLGCTADDTCVIGGFGGVIEETSDSGASWTPMTVPDGVGSIESINCAPTGACVAVATPAAGTPLGLNGGSVILTNGPLSSSS